MTVSKPLLALALASTALAAPATAQRLGQERPKDAKPQANDALPQTIPGAASTTGARKYTVSAKAQKAIFEYQNAVNLGETAKLPALLAAAQAVAKTPDEKFIVASNQTRAALNANDLAAMQAGIAAMQATGVADPADIVTRYTDLGRRYQKANQLDAALSAYNAALTINPSSASTLALLADVKNSQGQKAEAVALMQRSFAASKAAGQKVAESNYKFATGLAYAQRSPAAVALAREWVEAYPSATSWRDALRIYRDVSKPTGAQLIDLMRLGRAAGALSGETDYYMFANALVAAGNLGEAKAVLADAARDPKVSIGKDLFKGLTAKTAKAPGLAAAQAAAKSATTGAALLAAGDALYGAGAYAEAAAAYRAALGKGADSGTANLRLGMALALAGDKAGAGAALNAVSGVNADLARYWLLWLAKRA